MIRFGIIFALFLWLPAMAQDDSGLGADGGLEVPLEGDLSASEIVDEGARGEEFDSLNVGVDDVIPAVYRGMPKVALPESFPMVGLDLPLTASNEEARLHVIAGIHYIHLYWDQQALRHFHRALELDPQCPLAWWGVAMSLLPANNEFVAQRNVALATLPLLRDNGTLWERSLIDSLLVYPVTGVPGVVNELDGLLKLRPGDFNARCLKANFMRGGYAVDGAPLPDLARAREIVAELATEFPNHPIVQHYRLRVLFPAPFTQVERAWVAAQDSRKEQFSPYLYLELAQVLFTQGNFEAVRVNCSAGILLCQRWLEETGTGVEDCPLMVSLVEQDVLACVELGQLKDARKKAEELAGLVAAEGRERSAGAIALAYVARLLPARVEMRLGRWQEAIDLLPEISGPLGPDNLSSWSDQALSYYLQGRVAAQEQSLEKTRVAHGKLGELGSRYEELSPEAISAGEFPQWSRQLQLNSQYFLLLQAQTGRLVGNNDLAYQWLRSAIELNANHANEMPPLIWRSAQEEMGLLALDDQDFELARRAFDQALSGPARNQALAWLGLADAFLKLGDAKKAGLAAERFEQVWSGADRGEDGVSEYFTWAQEIKLVAGADEN